MVGIVHLFSFNGVVIVADINILIARLINVPVHDSPEEMETPPEPMAILALDSECGSSEVLYTRRLRRYIRIVHSSTVLRDSTNNQFLPTVVSSRGQKLGKADI